MATKRKKKTKKKKFKLEWSKTVTLTAILFGFITAWRAMDLMELAIVQGYYSTAEWITAAVGLAQAVILGSVGFYINLAKSDHQSGGITHDAAQANGFQDI